MDGTSVEKQLLKARERERIPLSRIRPYLLDRKARIIQQGAQRIPGELVAVLGMDGFPCSESNAKLSRWVERTQNQAFSSVKTVRSLRRSSRPTQSVDH
jgi:hypothetical protein